MVLPFVLWAVGFGNLNAQSNQQASDSMTTESFLVDAPAIARGVFQKEGRLNMALSKEQRIQQFMIKLDKTNYVLGVLEGQSNDRMAVASGNFHGAPWSYVNKRLIFKEHAVTNDYTPEEVANRFIVNLLANLGFPDLSRTNRVLDKDNHRILSTLADDGTPVTLRLTYDNDLIATATLCDTATGQEFTSVKYRYDTHFFGGRFPVEFTQSSLEPSEGGFKELYLIRIFALELSDRSLPDSDLDPQELFTVTKGHLHFYSNDILYSVGRSNTFRVPTSVEAQERSQRHHARKHKGITPFRVVILLLFAAAPITAMVLYSRTTQKQQTK